MALGAPFLSERWSAECGSPPDRNCFEVTLERIEPSFADDREGTRPA